MLLVLSLESRQLAYHKLNSGKLKKCIKQCLPNTIILYHVDRLEIFCEMSR